MSEGKDNSVEVGVLRSTERSENEDSEAMVRVRDGSAM